MNVAISVYYGKPLPLRVRPFPWEDLASVLSRASRRMGYEQPKWLLQPENSSYHLREEDLAWMCRKEDLLYLARLLGLDEGALYSMTVHRFASVLQYGTDPPVRQNARFIARPLLLDRSSFKDLLSTKVCPACLDQPDGYDRLYWRAEFILLCPNHALPLRANCPYCNKRIPALRAQLSQCPFCKKGDYRIPTARVLENSVLFQGELLLLKSLGVPFPQINVLEAMFTNSPLLSLRPADYFHLYRSMMGTLSHLFWPEDISKLCLKLHVLTQEEIAADSMLYGASQAPEVMLFHVLFSKWPDNFFLFLDIAYRAFILGGYYEEILRGFHTLFEEELPGETFTWIRQAYRDHLEQFQREKQGGVESEAFKRLYDAINGLY
jgi:hypothetical protein